MKRAWNPTNRMGTRLYDAVDLVVTERFDKLSGRKSILLFTDGKDHGRNDKDRGQGDKQPGQCDRDRGQDNDTVSAHSKTDSYRIQNLVNE
jgi:hypothetical protein